MRNVVAIYETRVQRERHRRHVLLRRRDQEHHGLRPVVVEYRMLESDLRGHSAAAAALVQKHRASPHGRGSRRVENANAGRLPLPEVQNQTSARDRSKRSADLDGRHLPHGHFFYNQSEYVCVMISTGATRLEKRT